MTILIGIALGLLIGGLIICHLSPAAKYPLAVTVIWWIGLLLAVCGALLILVPILNWITVQLRSALGV